MDIYFISTTITRRKYINFGVISRTSRAKLILLYNYYPHRITTLSLLMEEWIHFIRSIQQGKPAIILLCEK